MQRSFKISLSQEYYSEKVCLSQYDSDYAVNFEVLDKGAKAAINGMTAYFEGTRCDGLSFRYTGTASDNFISFTIDTALTAVAGRHTGEIVLYDGSGLWFGSANVQILVEKAARPDNAIDADVEEARSIAEQVQEIVDTAAEMAVNNWLDEHPEVTTTVQDGSITKEKLNESLRNKIDEESEFYGYDIERGQMDGVGYYFVTIPKVNYDGKRSVLKVGLADDTAGHTKTVNEFAKEKNASFAMNAGFFNRSNNNLPYGVVIIDGNLVYSGTKYQTNPNPVTLGIKEDGSFHFYDSKTIDGAALVEDGVKYAVTGRTLFIDNGQEVSGHPTGNGRLQMICCDDDNYFAFTTEKDFSYDNAVTFLLGKNVTTAYMLDSGGSTSTCVSTVKINSDETNDGRENRAVATFLYITRESERKNNDQKTIAFLLSDAVNEIRANAPSGAEHTVYVSNVTKDSTKNLNDLGIITKSGYYAVLASRSGNAGNTSSAYFIRYIGTEFNALSVIFEGSAVSAPRVSENGVLTVNGSTTNQIIFVRSILVGSVTDSEEADASETTS